MKRWRTSRRCKIAGCRSGVTLLEIQVATGLLALGAVTLGSTLATQSRATQRLQREFAPGANVYLNRSADPWQRRIGTPAQIATQAQELQTSPVASPISNTVGVLDTQKDLVDESITVLVQVLPNL